ncbi:MAG: hypothetical protein ACLVKA_09050 [Collinsella aerofaciens]
MAPQAASYFDDLKADGERMGVACCVTRGKQYIDSPATARHRWHS